MKFRKRLLPILMGSILLLTGCGVAQQTTSENQIAQIPYNPYEFSARQFMEEGGWELAKDTLMENLPKLFCEANSIVLDAGSVYEPILSVSGTTYDFTNAYIEGAVYTRPSTVDTEYFNWIDCVVRVPETDTERTHLLNFKMTDITRSERGEYTCLHIAGDLNYDSVYALLKNDIASNSLFIVNDEVVKEPLDYGVLECHIDENGYTDFEQIYDLALSMEEERITAYLLSSEQKNSVYFSMSDYVACNASNYTTEFNQDLVMQDLKEFAESFDLTVVSFEELPQKERQIKKEGWTVQATPYAAEQDGKAVQDYFRNLIRNIYIQNQTANVAFQITTVELEQGMEITIVVAQR